MSDVTNSCDICNSAPRWKDRPDAPGHYCYKHAGIPGAWGHVFIAEITEKTGKDWTPGLMLFGPLPPVPSPDTISPAGGEGEA